ncbi:UNVERIFIED_CONTAM: hypothetical protein PYX00_006369 [Menopon gallinae]|uniref:Venom dipeptidyl peptidase 4 n=1 Tax=Menopon gallinae TaxID=328185 RepID=A0AAW2HV31_9NEOP
MVEETNHPNGNAMEMGNADEDSGAKQKARTRKKVVTLSSAGIVVLGLIILGIVLLSKQPESAKAISSASTASNPNGVLLEEILDGSFTPRRFNGTFVSDNEILYRNDNGHIVLYDVLKGRTQVLIEGNFPILETALSYQLSADKRYLMVSHTFQKLYRYSFIAHYDIIDLNTRKSFPLTADEGSRLILLARWAPTGNGVAFVLHDTHDIYYRPNPEGPSLRVTRTGKPGVIYNGVPGLEEVFSSNEAMWFSRDGKRLAFASFNDTLTRVMSIPYYGNPGNLDFQYTRAVNIRYPKPGSPNPVVTLHIANLAAAESGPIKLAEIPAPGEVYPEPILTAVTWADEENLSAVWMNRVQNISYVTLCNAVQAECANGDSNGWMDFFTPPLFSHDGKEMVLILPQNQGGGHGEYRHVCIAEKSSGMEYVVRPITKGTFTVTEIVHFDPLRKFVYYLATEEDHPERLHLYEASTARGGSEPRCLTCDLKNELGGEKCLYNKALFSGGNSSSYALSCLGPGVPESKSKTMPVIERISVPVPGGFNAQAVIHLPPGIDKSGNVKYPLLVNVYSGPDSIQSLEKFNVDWSAYLTTQKNIIYATIDGRGSGLKGNDMLFSVYRRLGTYEIEDQISVTSYLQDRYPFIDRKRSAIWGWSYGGYATGMVLAQDKNNVFKCGISVAPVTDWAYYDTIYTERYMGLPRPDDNLLGYANAQLNDKIENLRNKEYFLIHGTLDDNVHYQQSMMLSKALEQSDILFRQQSYPDEDHGLDGVRPHLYHSLENFLDGCFETKEEQE